MATDSHERQTRRHSKTNRSSGSILILQQQAIMSIVVSVFDVYGPESKICCIGVGNVFLFL